mmetsp:Transcript_4175/g.9114  ORF Transcript_4175/g.9114 Transcript_4175/m.9114 type:complete len:132 (-) Transcript_4175:238-633(-)|eukprot:CAMPEP_0174721354 /NCGR_PEP_ID=MMETSP1094-20130205/35999_1 /TAXON_ID=156173 /ORGANISM="Chrysochromulina brevifilum, Strain UTEX LB 985" /LENGTH=131 /DNA_ID=CAMNT_0015922023 /DNA_START=15 /DNA_END=410 /DNA_ORIENTATION=+
MPRLLVALLFAYSTGSMAAENLFDKVYTMHVRDGTLLGGGRPKIECLPATLNGCNEQEVAYVKKIKQEVGITEAELKKESERLMQEERTKLPTQGSDDEYWLFQRKSIVYHLIDDAHKEANRNWARRHDEL